MLCVQRDVIFLHRFIIPPDAETTVERIYELGLPPTKGDAYGFVEVTQPRHASIPGAGEHGPTFTPSPKGAVVMIHMDINGPNLLAIRLAALLERSRNLEDFMNAGVQQTTMRALWDDWAPRVTRWIRFESQDFSWGSLSAFGRRAAAVRRWEEDALMNLLIFDFGEWPDMSPGEEEELGDLSWDVEEFTGLQVTEFPNWSTIGYSGSFVDKGVMTQMPLRMRSCDINIRPGAHDEVVETCIWENGVVLHVRFSNIVLISLFSPRVLASRIRIQHMGSIAPLYIARLNALARWWWSIAS